MISSLAADDTVHRAWNVVGTTRPGPGPGPIMKREEDDYCLTTSATTLAVSSLVSSLLTGGVFRDEVASNLGGPSLDGG